MLRRCDGSRRSGEPIWYACKEVNWIANDVQTVKRWSQLTILYYCLINVRSLHMSTAEDIQLITIAGRFLVSELLIMVTCNRQRTIYNI